MPDNAGNVPNMDLLPETAPGTRAAPVGHNGAAANATNGFVYELRGRPIRFERRISAASGFVPRCALGWQIGYAAVNVQPTEALRIQLSQSFLGGAAGLLSGVSLTPLADQGGVPTIRITNTATIQGFVLVVTLQIAEAKDDDREPSAYA